MCPAPGQAAIKLHDFIMTICMLYVYPLCTAWNHLILEMPGLNYENCSASNINIKVCPITGHEGPEGERRCSSTLSLTLALDGGGWSTPRPSRFTLGKGTQYPLCRRLGGPQGWSGQVHKISLRLGFDSRTIQPVASHYTD